MQLHTRIILFAASLAGAVAVVLGAWGAHGLHGHLDAAGMTRAWETAVQYQFWHVLALMALTALPLPARRVVWVALFWGIGIALFSGSLYALALDGPRWLGPVTPLGGLAFIIGWLLLAYTACARGNPDTQTAHNRS